jgi:hypothetical protein
MNKDVRRQAPAHRAITWVSVVVLGAGITLLPLSLAVLRSQSVIALSITRITVGAIMLHKSLKMKRSMHALPEPDVPNILEDNYLARWTYSPEEWAQHGRLKATRVGRQARPLALAGFLPLLGALFLLPRVLDTSIDSVVTYLTIALAALLFLGTLLKPYYAPWFWNRRCSEILIGRHGIAQRGRFQPFVVPSVRILDVQFIAEPLPTLSITTDIRLPLMKNTDFRYPVPAGHEAEAQRIAEQLRAVLVSA